MKEKSKIKKLFNVLFYILLVSYIIFTGFSSLADDWDRASDLRQLAEDEYEDGRITKEKYDELIKEAEDIEKTLKRIEKEEDEYKKKNNIAIDKREEAYHKYQRGELDEDEYQEIDDDLREEEVNWFDIGKMIVDAFLNALSTILNAICTFLLKLVLKVEIALYNVFSKEIFSVAGMSFYIENQNGAIGSLYNILGNTVRVISMSLLVLMALYKGFTTYILWKDGNPEENPLEIIFRYFFAVAMIFSFNELFGIAANIISSLNMNFTSGVGSISSNIFGGNMDDLNNVAQTLMTIILLIKILKSSFQAVMTLISKGVEILILRIGFPFACVSAVTPQAGGFHHYVLSILKGMFSIVLMNVLIGLSIQTLSSGMNFKNALWSIAILETANNGGSIINSIISAGGGGGGTGNEVIGGIQSAGVSAGRMATKAGKAALGAFTGGAGAVG